MTRLLIIIVLVISPNIVISGQIPIQLLLHDLCDESPIAIDWEIVNSIGETIIKNKEGKYLLQDGENYFATTVYYRGQYMRLVNLTFTAKYELHKKVVEIPRIAKFHSGNSVHFDEVFLNCKDLCAGECTDFYQNDTPRLKGRFSDGKPRGRIVYYNTRGEVDLIEKYSKRGTLRKSITKKQDQ